MSCILLLETATKVCSVAISENGKLLALKESHSANSHSSVITTYVSEVMSVSGKNQSNIDAVCVSMGPGSYTGLRIGVSTAKGLCYAWNKPLIAINTLLSMALHFLSEHSRQHHSDALLCPMIDARRMEVYNAIFDLNGNFIRDTSAEIITENSFSGSLQKQKIIFFGDGAGKCKEILSLHKNAVIIYDFLNSANGMLSPAFLKYQFKQFENTAYFEPYYLKDFIATKPKKLI
ncbi:MAG: tRNA (adenosine(37)-N6)-threonylcarbamoyltransferase complex dimerization subunit type 1 TsaB [Bacteroidota bacterium]